jgi:inositol-phosphate transport system ATP-binding protein
MTALANILFPLRFQNLAPAVAEARAREAAALTQIDGLLDRKPSELSGGQQQRVALARALVKRPNLLLLDEPLSNLDATLRLTMRAELKRLTRSLGVTTILVTHDQLEATTMADRVVCMNAGRIEQVGTAEDLYARPDTLFVAGFIGAPPMNRLPGRAEGGTLHLGQARLAVSGASGAVTFGLRPEAVRPVAGGLPARIMAVEPMGREALYLAETEAGPLHFLEAGPQPRLREGDRLHLGFDPARTLLFDADGRRIPGATAALEPAHA